MNASTIRSTTPAPRSATDQSAASEVTVKAGDTMTAIAARHEVTFDALREANPQIMDPDLITPGQVLRVPPKATAPVDAAPPSTGTETPAARTPASDGTQRETRRRAVAAEGDLASRLRNATDPSVPAPLMEEVEAGRAVLQRDQSGPQVKDLQERLTKLGFGVQTTGVYGPTTEGVVKDFQKAHGVGQTGQVGKTTLDALAHAELQAVKDGKVTLRNGDQNGSVKLMQEALTKAGFGVQATGIFGETTEKTLKDFQRARGLEPDGVFGPKSARALAGNQSSAQAHAGAPNSTQALSGDTPVTGTSGDPGAVSGRAQAEMNRLLAHSRAQSVGRRPDGKCYTHVANFLDQVPAYGKVGGRQFNAQVPQSHWAEARQFAEWANRGDNAAKMGLRRLPIDNPYDAPPGAIVVVRAGTPGTAHPTAGDIAVRGTGNDFYNGGMMSYGGRRNFPPGNNLVLGIYVPA